MESSLILPLAAALTLLLLVALVVGLTYELRSVDKALAELGHRGEGVRR